MEGTTPGVASSAGSKSSAEAKGSEGTGETGGAGVEPSRVLAIKEQRNEAQRLGIGEGRDEEAQKFAQGKGGVNFA